MNMITNLRQLFGAKKSTPSQNKQRQSKTLVKTAVDRVKMDMSKLTAAVESALDPQNPDRLDLIGLYESSWKDSQVIAEREKAEAFVITEPFEVQENDKADKEKTKLFERPWFTEFLSIATTIDFWEYTLVEFQEQDEKGEFVGVKIFPRLHVKPLSQEIVINPTDNKGVFYGDQLSQNFLLELGDPEKAGKLESITREVIWKTFARSDWSEYNERFGKPLLDWACDTTNESELNRKQEMAESFGSNCYILRDIDEEVNITHVASRASCENFKDMANFCDDQISKLMNGQTGTTDEKSFVGSAEVHERVLNEFTKARLKRIQDVINYKLIPFLIDHGYPFTENTRFIYPILYNKSDNKPKNPETDPNKEPDTENTASGKKKIGPLAKLGYEYNGRVIPLMALAGETEINYNESIIDFMLKRIFKQGSRKVVDPDVWQNEYSQMAESITKGYGNTNVKFGTQDWKTVHQLKYNTAVFDAFKCNKQMKDVYKLLVDDNGNTRSWRDFRDEALKLCEKYNKRWLQTEYNMAHASAVAARKWQDIQRNKDFYPNLRYVAVDDERTRDEHRALDGCVIPVDHPLWDEIYPPNGWECRCSVQPTDAPIRLPLFTPSVPEMFRTNVGKTARIFDASHPYYDISESDKEKALQFVHQNICDSETLLKNFDEFESIGSEWIRDYFNGNNGGYHVTHTSRREAALVNKTEKAKFNKERDMCKVFADNGYRIEHLAEKPGISSPDVMIDGKKADLKRVANANNIVKYAKKAVEKQGAEVVLFQVDEVSHTMHNEFNKLKKKGIKCLWFDTIKRKVHRI